MSTGFTLGALEITDAATSRTNLGLGNASTISYLDSTWMPTLVGSVTAGTTAYSAQTGLYTQIGNMVYASGIITITSATGTGDATISLPVAVGASANPVGSVLLSASGWAWPAAKTCMNLQGTNGTSAATIACTGTAQAAANLQMTNAAATITFSIFYFT